MRDARKSYVTGESRWSFLGRHVSKLKTVVMTAAAGFLIGTQIYDPNKRVIEAIAGGVLLLILWKFSTLAALWALLIGYPFPFSISWGTSNEIFMMIIVLILLLRIATGAATVKIDQKLRWPLILMVVSYFISLKNVVPGLMRLSLINTFVFLSAASFMVLIINYVDDEEKLRKTMNILMVSVALFLAFTIFEVLFPGRVIIPNWLYTTSQKARLVMKGVRMGGPFHDYELAAEYFTLNAFLIFFMYVRSKRMAVKWLFGLLLLVDIFLMFSTITRGAIFSLILGTGYLMFLSRKELNIVRVTYIVGGLALILVLMEYVVARYTTSGSLFERVIGTLAGGQDPTNRLGTWLPAIERGMENPLFGHGPGWDFAAGLTKGFWPHCLYLFYFNITGFFGLGAFLYLIAKIVRSTVTGVKASIVSSPFPEALMKILHVMIVIFLFDQIKIEYLRNVKYTYFIWFMFGLIIATHNIIIKQRAEREKASEAS